MALLKPDKIARSRETPAPTIIPAQAPVRFILFHHRPRKYGARKAPEMVPHEKDISVRIGVLKTAIRKERTINTKQRTRVCRSVLALSSFFWCAAIRSREIAEHAERAVSYTHLTLPTNSRV